MEAEHVERVYLREAIARALDEEMARDERVILFGQDVAAFGGSYGETRGLFERFGPKRVRNTPVAESSQVGIALGAAACGFRTVTCITYMDFVTLGLDPLVNYAAKMRYKTGGQLHAPMVVKTTAGAKGQGVAHSQCFAPWLMSVPGLKVVAPSNAWDAYGLLKSAIRDDDPVVYIDHKRLFPLPGIVPNNETLVPLGSARIVRNGRDVTLVSYSYMTRIAVDAADALAAKGVSCEVVDLRSLAPLDLETVCNSVGRTGTLLSIEESQTVCGVGAELAFRVREQLPTTRVSRVGPLRAPVSSNPVLEAFALPTVDRIARAVLQMVEARK